LGNVEAVRAEIESLKDSYKEASKAVTDAEGTHRKYTKSLTEATNATTVAQKGVSGL
jgi:phage-related tail protein